MKYYKFEKIVKGENPIIAVTYKTWYGSLVRKDICRHSSVEGFWAFMESGESTYRFDPINNFYNGDNDVYWVNNSVVIEQDNK